MPPLQSTPIRPAAVSDAPAIAELEKTCFATAGETFHLRQIRALIRNPRAGVFVAGEPGTLLGWSAGLLRRHRAGGTVATSGRLYAVAVNPEARGQKLGRRLTQAVLEDLTNRGARWIALEVREGNDAAIALYESFGFRLVDRMEDYYEPGVAALRMRK